MDDRMVRTSDAKAGAENEPVDRRKFLNDLLAACCAGAPLMLGVIRLPSAFAQETDGAYDPTEHLYGMGLDVNKCIGCA